MSKPMSKKARVELRQATYRPFVPPEMRCQTCANFSSAFTSAKGNCTIDIRSNSNHRNVDVNAVCDAWEPRP